MTETKKRTHIGTHEILRRLGRGGMGTVYLCHDPILDREVAIKLLDMKGESDRKRARTPRFVREAMVTAQLQHPGIPPVYHVDQTRDGVPYYVMMPIEGRSLQDVLNDLRDNNENARERYDIFTLIEAFRDVCRIVQYAHSKGMLHRDLKPGNIFLGNYGGVYVIDWGLAKRLQEEKKRSSGSRRRREILEKAASSETVLISEADERASTLVQSAEESDDIEEQPLPVPDYDLPVDSASDLTMDGDVLGTLAYMPPEQAEGAVEDVGHHADIYALGVILYEILTLQLPVDGATLKEVVDQKNRGEIEPPDSRAPDRDIPPELSAICMQAMAPLPEERFRSVSELSRALAVWLEGKSQFRHALKSSLDWPLMKPIPRRRKYGWEIRKDAVHARPLRESSKPTYLLFEREFPGDVRFTSDIIAWPHGDETTINEFAIVLNATVPQPFKGYLDAYIIHLGADQNTRAYLTKNESEVASNEHVVLEPRRRYRLAVEHSGKDLRVMLNRQVILFYRDHDPLSGLQAGFLHRGEGVAYANVRIQTRGAPMTVPSIEVPEALMEEECYEAAEKRFIAIARAHRNRFEGAWAYYRAGIAAFKRTGDRSRALRIWSALKRGPFPILIDLGKASLALEKNDSLGAARIIRRMLDENPNASHLDPVADIVFAQAQQYLRTTQKGKNYWPNLDAWVRLALILGKRVESKRSMTPSILWRWILLALSEYQDSLPGCIGFLRQTFGKGQGAFAEILTTIEPLISILNRSAAMAEHSYLVDKVMRLILNHDDNLGNMETLARFYLHAGHIPTAERISQHIVRFCREKGYVIPPMPVALVGVRAWLRSESDTAQGWFGLMIEESEDWARPDGHILLGLDAYARGDMRRAAKCWREVRDNPESSAWNRHLVVEGLLGQLPADPVLADVPNRSDHQLMYCLFLGYQKYLDWKRTGDHGTRATAEALLRKVLELQRPSYDIYSSTEDFARLPLEAMGCALPERIEPEPISEGENDWINRLAVAAAEEEPREARRTSSNAKGPSRARRATPNRT